jgi:hypothetical protein
MRVNLLVALILVVSAGGAGAIVDFSAGAYGGMDIPVVNDEASSGRLFGVQGRVTVLSWLGLGAHFHKSTYGDVTETFLEGTPDAFESKLDGGETTVYAVDAYLGTSGSIGGVNVFLVGSFGKWKWTTEYKDDISEILWAVGPGVEYVFPFGLGVEGRGMFQIIPTDNDGSYKSVYWFIGANYHFGNLINP